MEAINIISAFESRFALQSLNNRTFYKLSNLKICEAKTLSLFYKELIHSGYDSFDIFDGYFIGYEIHQISKEFDLLRFSDNLVIDIELKSDLGKYTNEEKNKKILKQMKQNHYYLKFLDREILIYTYVENDGIYKYNNEKKIIEKSSIEDVILNLSFQKVNFNINPDDLFVPSNYLISPFNKTENFVNGEYFLNGAQDDIKKEIIKSINDDKFFCISANAGTGKTLLIYDIAKSLKEININSVIIHCGKLNNGHKTLVHDYNWCILSISNINNESVKTYINDDTKIIFIDESQLISNDKLELLIERAKQLKIVIVFSYDIKLYLKDGESKDIYSYLKQNYPKTELIKRGLTNKIRTNKSMYSFIKNMFNIGSCNNNLNYSDISIEYFSDFENTKKYIEYLEEYHGWTSITYTSSNHSQEKISHISKLGSKNAHDVIGQEFEKVVFVMDKNFNYGDSKRLQTPKAYYSVRGMLYQIVTRVINQLKIIVLDNPELYVKLMEIKSLEKND